MKNLNYAGLIPVLLFLSAFLKPLSEVVPEGALKGDFNGDGKPDYVWLLKPQLNNGEDDCIGPCTVQIVCSLPGIKAVSLKQMIGGTLTNLGDMDGDGKDDIGLLPEWFTSCWRNYYTFRLQSGRWIPLAEPFPTHCNQWEAKIKPVEKVPGRPGYLKINYSVIGPDRISVQSKLIRIHQ